MKKYCVLFLALLCIGQLSAQRRGQNMDPETRAKQQTQVMTDSLLLSAAQSEKVGEVNLEYAKKMAAARAEMRNSDEPDYDTMRSMMQQLRKEQNEAINKYLTAEQTAKWKSIQENNQQNRQGRRGKGNRKQKNDSKTDPNQQ